MDNQDDLVVQYEEEYIMERTEASLRLDAKKKVLLDEAGLWDLSWFSPPGEALKCEHPMPRLAIRGGLPLYVCDECDHYLLGIGVSAFIIPKQHLVPYCVMLMSHFLKYEGPKALAESLHRPHKRLDREGNPALPPIETLKEVEQMWEQAIGYLTEYKALGGA